MATVDWSKLPTDLLNLISQRIDDDELDLIRFRSVCSTWRSSSIPNHHYILPYKFPVFKLPFISEQNDKNPPFCHLSKQNIFLIKPPQQQQEQQTLLRPWLIRVSQNTRGKTRFFHPLFCDSPLPRINLILDFRKLSLLHLGSNTFTRDFDTYSQHQPFNSDYMFPEKVIAATCHGKNPLIVATISSHPKPLLSKFGNEKWKVIPDMSMEFGDICLFKGRAYAVDKIGKTIMVGSDSNVHLVAEPLDGGENKKLLVESDGDLLLACVHAFPVISVDLFKLNEKEKKWVKLTSLGDKVLFLGIKCSFSASFSDLYVAKGNCVIISADILRRLSRLGSHALKSPSPWEKQMSTIYTHAIFKKFQVEVLGVAGCQSRIEVGDGTAVRYIVQDYEKDEEFLVTWNELSSEVSCFCRLFEYKGFLCRHALSVLQRCGCSSVPSHYIMKRWTKDAKIREPAADRTQRIQTRPQRYNDLCKRSIALSEEGSSSEESYNIALRALIDALKNCVLVNNSNDNGAETGNNGYSLREAEEYQSTLASKPSKKRNTTRKRKVQQEQSPVLVDAQVTLQQMDNLSSDAIALNGYYGTQQNVQGLHVQLNLMEPPHDGYYVNQHSMQGLGPLNSMAPSHDGYFGTQPSIHGMGGQLEYRPTTTFGYTLQDEPDPDPHFHSNSSRNT